MLPPLDFCRSWNQYMHGVDTRFELILTFMLVLFMIASKKVK